MPSCYIIIVTYNGRRWIDQCIKSIQSSSVPVNIILIDNFSKDDTVGYVKKNFKNVEIFELNNNIGFGPANNIGIKKALERNCDYVFLLNQDTRVDSNTLEILVSSHKNNENYGIVSPIHMNGSGSCMDGLFHTYLTNHLQHDNILTTDLLINNSVGKLFDIYFVNAAAWLISRETIKKVGGFDPLFPHWGEDNNYIDRIRYHNLHVGICRDTKIYHDREIALGDRTAFYQEYYYRTKLRKILDPGQNNDFNSVSKEIFQDLKESILNIEIKKSHQLFNAYVKLRKGQELISSREKKYKQPYCFLDY